MSGAPRDGGGSFAKLALSFAAAFCRAHRPNIFLQPLPRNCCLWPLPPWVPHFAPTVAQVSLGPSAFGTSLTWGRSGEVPGRSGRKPHNTCGVFRTVAAHSLEGTGAAGPRKGSSGPRVISVWTPRLRLNKALRPLALHSPSSKPVPFSLSSQK